MSYHNIECPEGPMATGQKQVFVRVLQDWITEDIQLKTCLRAWLSHVQQLWQSVGNLQLQHEWIRGEILDLGGRIAEVERSVSAMTDREGLWEESLFLTILLLFYVRMSRVGACEWIYILLPNGLPLFQLSNLDPHPLYIMNSSPGTAMAIFLVSLMASCWPVMPMPHSSRCICDPAANKTSTTSSPIRFPLKHNYTTLALTVATTMTPHCNSTFRPIMTYDVPTLPSHLTPAPATPSALPISTGSLGYTGSRCSTRTLNGNITTPPFTVHSTTTLIVTEVDLSTFTSVTVVGPSVPSGNGLEHLGTTPGQREFPQRSEIYTSWGGRQE
ncbi:hypothetical protein C7212DRAFT_346751 [Tuber magnatum]|uniref:Uncharacterized protein n=1 Tax=Tuber magnatum TaxID=42249 RepID=A0A317SKR1_9PEZI|nr:hypothetical protein C7212DRAFT_346751 [Tuber magnatum]